MDMILPVFAAISGQALVMTVVWIILIGIVAGLLWWLIGYCALPAPFDKVARVIVAVAAVLFLINVLLGLVDKAFIKW